MEEKHAMATTQYVCRHVHVHPIYVCPYTCEQTYTTAHPPYTHAEKLALVISY